MGQQLRQLDARLAGALESEGRAEEIAGLGMKMNLQIAAVAGAVEAVQLRFRIKKVHLAWTAVLKEADHGGGAGRMVRRTRRKRICGRSRFSVAVLSE